MSHEYSSQMDPPPPPPRTQPPTFAPQNTQLPAQGTEYHPGEIQYDPSYTPQPSHGVYTPPPPPQRLAQDFGIDDLANPIHFTRDPHKLIAYLVPFPKPELKDVDPNTVPIRFMIYTPPPPPLGKPTEGDKESKLHKIQRKWQEEVRSAKTSTAKTASWKGVKSKATRGIDWAMSQTTSSNLDFLGRVSPSHSPTRKPSTSTTDASASSSAPTTKLKVEEMILIHPISLSQTMNQE